VPRFGRQFLAAGDSVPAGYFSDESDGGLSWSESPRRSAAPTPGDNVRHGKCSCLAYLAGSGAGADCMLENVADTASSLHLCAYQGCTYSETLPEGANIYDCSAHAQSTFSA